MTKHYYLFPEKIAVSEMEKPTENDFGNKFEFQRYCYDMAIKKWHSSLIFYPIASKEDEAQFIRLAKKSHFAQYNNYNLSLQQGIKINSENVELKMAETYTPSISGVNYTCHGTLARFVEPSRPEETQEKKYTIPLTKNKTAYLTIPKDCTLEDAEIIRQLISNIPVLL